METAKDVPAAALDSFDVEDLKALCEEG